VKKIALALVLLFLASVAFAEESPAVTNTPTEEAVVSADALPVQTDSPLLVEQAVTGTCTAEADCWDGSTVSCSLSGGSGTCDFADSSCPSEHGWVTCGWQEVHCPSCPCPPPASKCIDGRSCTLPCGSECGPGTCVRGSCNCLI